MRTVLALVAAAVVGIAGLAAAPAAHNPSRLVMPKHPSAPAVASASAWGTDSCTRPVRSSREANGPLAFRSSTMRWANSSPICRTVPSPSRTSVPRFSHVAYARLAFTSGPCTSTPCRRASATNDCGE